jgi:hypothetical protein
MAQDTKKSPPKTLLSVRDAEIKLVTYTDPGGAEVTQPVLVGENQVLLLDSRTMLGASERTPTGFATAWLREAILKATGRDVTPDVPKNGTIPVEES